ncbi:MAG: hypothetical protein IKZ51_00865 [Bacteroidales bacterium]|nr:hypothetical protein [Bacteroidales bacterium]
MRRLDLRNYSKIALAGVVFLFVHSLRYFDFVGLNEGFYVLVTKLLALSLIALCAISRNPKRIPGGYWMLALLVVPMLSFLPAWLENGQSPFRSFSSYLPFGLALVYFILHKSRVSPSELIRIITILALVRIGIFVIQQFTYPYYLFSFRPEGLDSYGLFSKIEVRSGIYRYYIEDTYLSMFLVFYYLQKAIKRRQTSDIVLFLVGLAGVYLDQSRQFMLSTLLAVLFVLLFSSTIRNKWWLLIGAGVIIGVVLLNSEKLFDDLLYMTQKDISSDNIRIMAYTTYAFEFWGGILSVIFGNGPVGNSAYGEQVQYMYENLHLFHADVGLVGAANLYGVVTVLLFLSFFIFFVFRNWRKLQMHLKMYYIAMLVNAPLVTIYTQNINWFVFFAFMLYLSDRSIIAYDRKKMLLRSLRNNVIEAKA